MMISRVAMATLTLAALARLSAAQPAPQPLADMSKPLLGTWKCTGKSISEDMKSMVDLTGSVKRTLEMDGFWMHTVFDAKMGKIPYHYDSFDTFDAKTGWRRIMVASGGDDSVATSDGPKDNKIDWAIDAHGSMGPSKGKDHLDWSDPKAGVKALGEWSMDGGKTYIKIYEMTCKK